MRTAGPLSLIGAVLPRLNPLPHRLLGRARMLVPDWPWRRERSHYVRDYRRLVLRLLADHPRDEAMSLAVGGDYEAVGAELAAVLAELGLRDGMSLIDIGCGSGRLAHALAARLQLDYLGVDVTPEVLAYARARCPPAYRFLLRTDLRLPAPDAGTDMVCAFSVFTHLLNEETYLYLEEAARVLRPGGLLVFSFLEFGDDGEHWADFERTARAVRAGVRGPLNMFMERSVISLWAKRLGFEPPVFPKGGEGSAAGDLGQSVAVLRRPAA